MAAAAASPLATAAPAAEHPGVARLGRVARIAIVYLLAWAFIVVWVPLLIVLTLLTFGRLTDSLGRRMIRGWGRTLLTLAGARLEIEPASRDELDRRRRRVMTFNHASTLDMFAVTAIYPPGATSVIKRELLRVPILGQAAFLLDFVPIDRSSRERAAASLLAAVPRLRRRDGSLLIAPEGTRSRTGQLGPFKLGAFHAALAAEAPIVPVVLYGPAILWPYGAAMGEPGRVVVRALPEIPTASLDPERLHEAAEALRRRYVVALSEMERLYGDPRRGA